jgi:hypothetical protein
MNAELGFQCDQCDEIFKTYEEASDCCPPGVCQVWVCSKCKLDYMMRSAAEQCCAEKEVAP